jgi:two-component system phosphate regulon sensor histidine kinase PhoR
MTDSGEGIVPSPERARASSWGGSEAWAELRRIAEEARLRSGFHVSLIEVLRGDGFLEEVAFAGRSEEQADMGESFSLGTVLRVLQEGTRYGSFVFMAEEDMDPMLQELVRGYGYVPTVPDSDDPERWRALDMLVAPLVDSSGNLRALLHLDEPISGRRPPPAELQEIADRLDLLLQAAVSTVDREELTRHARLDETARSVVRAASRGLSVRDLLADVHLELAAGFRSRALALLLHDRSDELGRTPVPAVALPEDMLPAVEAAARRAWESRTVIIAEPGHVWGDDQLDRDHRADLTDHLLAHDVGELLLVPVGAGPESMGVLVVVRDGRTDRWTESESAAALGVGHDLGRALLSTRAHEREQHLIEELQRVVKARRESEELLRDTVRKQTEVVERLEALDVQRSTFIATASHELRTPVTSILGYTEMLADGECGDLTPMQYDLVSRVVRNGRRLQHLIDDLLNLERTESRDLIRTEVDVRELTEQVWGQLQIHLAGRDLTTTTKVSADLPKLSGDLMQLERALLNVLVNAVKFTPDGGVVHLSVQTGPTGVTFTVSDTGLGIAESEHEAVFEPFFRSHVAHSNAIQGSGIGLAVVQRIIQSHGGEIALSSTLGEGTTVSFTLPVPAPDSSGRPPNA